MADWAGGCSLSVRVLHSFQQLSRRVLKTNASQPQISARSLLCLRRGRQDSVQAQVHGGGCVVIGPAARESEGADGAGELASAEKFDVVAELRVVHLAQRVGAEIERR